MEHNKLQRVRERIVRSHPFYATVLYRLPFKLGGTATAATDGSFIYWSPEFLESITTAEVEGVTAHECLHVALCHHTRRRGRDADLWNQACDYAINGTLISQGFSLPKGGLYDSKYLGWSAENIYADLLKQQQAQPESGSEDDSQGDQGDEQGDDENGSDSGSEGDSDVSSAAWGEVRDAVSDDGDALGEAEMAEVERDIAALVHEARLAEERAGKGAGGWLREITDAHRGRTQPWNQILRNALTDIIRSSETWNELNRRVLHFGIRLPSYDTKPNGILAIAIDTSCSLVAEMLSEIGNHLRDIIDTVKPKSVIVMYCDSTINHVDVFDMHDEVELKMYGGGGTEFNPPFNYLDRNDIEPDALVYFTDGEGFVGETGLTWCGEPDYPVFWATTNCKPYFLGVPEFGETIYLNEAA